VHSLRKIAENGAQNLQDTRAEFLLFGAEFWQPRRYWEILDFVGDRWASWLTRRWRTHILFSDHVEWYSLLHVVCVCMFSVRASASYPNICWMPQWVAVAHSARTCVLFLNV